MSPRAAETSRMAKTNAKQTYCLSEKDLEELVPKEAPNPFRPRGPKQKLYLDSELEDLAIKKWGSPEGFQKERDLRAAKRLEKAASPQKSGEAALLTHFVGAEAVFCWTMGSYWSFQRGSSTVFQRPAGMQQTSKKHNKHSRVTYRPS